MDCVNRILWLALFHVGHFFWSSVAVVYLVKPDMYDIPYHAIVCS